MLKSVDKVQSSNTMQVNRVKISNNITSKVNVYTNKYFSYGDNNNDRMIFYLDVNIQTDSFTFENAKLTNNLDDKVHLSIIDVRFYPLSEINKKEFEYVNPPQIDVISNK